jgi:hypothetical protein
VPELITPQAIETLLNWFLWVALALGVGLIILSLAMMATGRRNERLVDLFSHFVNKEPLFRNPRLYFQLSSAISALSNYTATSMRFLSPKTRSSNLTNSSRNFQAFKLNIKITKNLLIMLLFLPFAE